jgi:hypothetical protein
MNRTWSLRTCHIDHKTDKTAGRGKMIIDNCYRDYAESNSRQLAQQIDLLQHL